MIGCLGVVVASLMTLEIMLPTHLNLVITWRSKSASAIIHSVVAFGGVQTTTCFLNSRWGRMLTRLDKVDLESRSHSIAPDKLRFR